MSGFNSQDCFASGPHEFEVWPSGSQWSLKVDLGLAEPGLEVLGDHRVGVTVRGRLTAGTAPGLWALVDALASLCGVKADLSDDAGRTWTGISLLDVRWDGPPATGRVWSIGYTARFAET